MCAFEQVKRSSPLNKNGILKQIRTGNIFYVQWKGAVNIK